MTPLLDRRNQALGGGMPLFYDEPLHIVRGEGAYLYDPQGRRYVDMYNNVPCVGHAHPRVAEAMARQQATLNVHSRYLHEGVVAFAERLTALHGPQIESVIFSCSGTEAIEVALRTARFATGARGIVCTNATYHGNSELVGSLTRLGDARSTNPDIRAIPFPDPYRPLIPGADAETLEQAYLDRLTAAVADLKATGSGFAALIVCSIFANEGLPDLFPGFMRRVTELVHAEGGLVIADEVQAGYGRTGGWWGYDVAGFTPDLVVTGKPMGAGLPLAATAASRALVEGFRARTRYFNTFASSPLQAAVGMTVLDILEDEQLIASAARVGPRLKAALAQRQARWPVMGDVRGHGLFIGVEMVSDAQTRTPDRDAAVALANKLKSLGYLTSPAALYGNVLKIRPPLVFSDVDADGFLAAFDQAMGELHG